MRKVNIKQLSEESGIEIKGVVIKDDKITFLDISDKDKDKLNIELKTHIPIHETINNEIIDKLDEILEKLK